MADDGSAWMQALTEDERESLDRLWNKYHDDGEKPLVPSEVYFDFGYMFGLISKLSNKVIRSRRDG